jgi:hypothetical protein
MPPLILLDRLQGSLCWLAKEFIVYDALYPYCQEEVNAGRN